MKELNAQRIINYQVLDGKFPEGFYPTSPFMGNFFCKIDNYNLEFMTIAKNAGTYLRHIAIYAKTGQIADSENTAHAIVGYSPLQGYLVPENEPQKEGTIRFAVWRDPIERLISSYKYFCLERNIRYYFMYMDLYRDSSFERFMEFVHFELKKSNPLYQDEHFRKQSDYYSPGNVDYIVHIDKLDMFLREFNVPLIKGNTNSTHARFELTDKTYIEEIKELYKSDYAIKTNY